MYPYKAIKVNGKKIDEHRYLMEKKIGRKLGFNEIVHHEDDNKRNNELDNLKLTTRSEHSRYHRLRGDTGGFLPRQHGVGSYRKGCRCDKCKQSHKERMRRYRALQKIDD